LNLGSDIVNGHHDSYAALRIRDFRLLASGGFLQALGEDMLGVAVGWELYQRTGSALALGFVGLVQIVPTLLLSLPAGHYVDRHDRKRIVTATTFIYMLAAAALALVSIGEGPVLLVYAALLVIGLCRAFHSPSMSSLLPQIVPRELYPNAAAWESSMWQVATIAGPAIGGLGIWLLGGVSPIYVGAAVLFGVTSLMFSRMRPHPAEPSDEPMTLESLLAGLRFVRATKVILASITLDMVAVLLAGATALLPIFAEDLLDVGASGLGVMRAAPAIGAVLMSLVIAHRAPFKLAGRTLLLAVAGFGMATVLFGASNSLWLSLVALFLIGAFDSISMVIRGTLVMASTPDRMRGRVNAVHFVFIGLSNELGAFESGVAAELLGARGAVIAGGLATLIVVPAIAYAWPEVRRLKRLQDVKEAAVPSITNEADALERGGNHG
jgi:MFS family permease